MKDKIIDILNGMDGIGGVPTDKEFLDEFEFRLLALKPNTKLLTDKEFKIEQLRAKFYDECCEVLAGEKLPKVFMAPHDLFEWFLRNIKDR